MLVSVARLGFGITTCADYKCPLGDDNEQDNSRSKSMRLKNRQRASTRPEALITTTCAYYLAAFDKAMWRRNECRRRMGEATEHTH